VKITVVDYALQLLMVHRS